MHEEHFEKGWKSLLSRVSSELLFKLVVLSMVGTRIKGSLTGTIKLCFIFLFLFSLTWFRSFLCLCAFFYFSLWLCILQPRYLSNQLVLFSYYLKLRFLSNWVNYFYAVFLVLNLANKFFFVFCSCCCSCCSKYEANMFQCNFRKVTLDWPTGVSLRYHRHLMVSYYLF